MTVLSVVLLGLALTAITCGVYLLAGLGWALVAFGVLLVCGELLLPGRRSSP